MEDKAIVVGRHGTYTVGWEPNCIDDAEIKVCVARKFWFFSWLELVYDERLHQHKDEFLLEHFGSIHSRYQKSVEKYEKMIDNRLKVQELRNGQK